MQPQIFIGSSVEGIRIAKAIQVGMEHFARAIVWDQAFTLSWNSIDTLLEKAAENEFAVFVFSSDDVSDMRGTKFAVARDNVIFEAGMFMGAHGKEKVFVVHPRVADFHIPSDLLGFTPATYDPEWAKKDINAAVGPVVTKITQAIEKSFDRNPHLTLSPWPSWKDDATWPLKLNITVGNQSPHTVAVDSRKFSYKDPRTRAPNAELANGVFVPKFRLGRNEKNEDIYRPICVLTPGQEVETWVPFHPDLTKSSLQEIVSRQEAGIWNFRCFELKALPSARLYEQPL